MDCVNRGGDFGTRLEAFLAAARVTVANGQTPLDLERQFAQMTDYLLLLWSERREGELPADLYQAIRQTDPLGTRFADGFWQLHSALVATSTGRFESDASRAQSIQSLRRFLMAYDLSQASQSAGPVAA